MISAICAPGWWRRRALLKLSNRFVIRDSGVQETMPWGARQAEVEDLPDDVLLYLLGSRYCDTDKLATLAWKMFGKVEAGWPRVQAILDYTHDRIRFGYQPRPRRPHAPPKPMPSARACAATSPIWRSPCAAA